MTETTLIVLAKEPRAGSVKTRLTPPRTPEQAAELALAALRDTLDAVAATAARRRLLVLDGEPDALPVPAGFDVLPQVSGGLDRRIAAAMSAAGGPAVLVGMDTPHLTSDDLHCDFDAYPAWLGPATDGGFWLIGLAEPDPALLIDVPMSVPHTWAAQRRRLLDHRLPVGLLPERTDVDTWCDAERVAATAPHTRFARAVARFAVDPPAADQPAGALTIGSGRGAGSATPSPPGG